MKTWLLSLFFMAIALCVSAQFTYQPPITGATTPTTVTTASGTMGHTIGVDVRVSPTTPNNQIGIAGDGLFVPKGAGATVQNALTETVPGTYEWGGTMLHSTTVNDPTNNMEVAYNIGRVSINNTANAATQQALLRVVRIINSNRAVDQGINVTETVPTGVNTQQIFGVSNTTTIAGGASAQRVWGFYNVLQAGGSVVNSARGIELSTNNSPAYYRGISVQGPTGGTQRMFVYLGTNSSDFNAGRWSVYNSVPLKSYFSDSLWIGTTAGNRKLTVSGGASKTGGGAFDVFSDSRSKEHIEPYTRGLDLIRRINPVDFDYTADFIQSLNATPDTSYIIPQAIIDAQDAERWTGVIAQELEAIAPELVTTETVGNIKDFKMVKIAPLTFALINAVKEMDKRIKALERKVKP